jgi:hypothetical protein
MANFLTDLVNAVTVAQLLTPRAITGSSAINGTVSDFLGSAVRNQEFAVVQTGTLVDGTYVVKIQEGLLADGSDMGDISGATVSLAATDDNTNSIIPFYRTKRYIRAVVTPTSATTGGPIAVLGLAQKHRPGGTTLVP